MSWKEDSVNTLNGIDLGRFGLFTFDYEFQPAAQIRESIQEVEDLGWAALWIPELLGREAFTHAGYLLANSEEIATRAPLQSNVCA